MILLSTATDSEMLKPSVCLKYVLGNGAWAQCDVVIDRWLAARLRSIFHLKVLTTELHTSQ